VRVLVSNISELELPAHDPVRRGQVGAASDGEHVGVQGVEKLSTRRGAVRDISWGWRERESALCMRRRREDRI
jgi:hypothetical protein